MTYRCDVIVRLMEEEGNAESLEAEKRKLEDKVDSLNGSIENLELHIQKVRHLQLLAPCIALVMHDVIGVVFSG